MRTTGMLLIAIAALLPAREVSAQRGAQHLNSPGYQRALAESRKPKVVPAPPATVVTKKRPRRVRAD